MVLIEIKDLHASVNDIEILRGVNLKINRGEVVALLGPNGHGKSTLLQVIMGHPNYKVTKGEILYKGQDVLAMSVDERARAGLFLAMQNPSEVPGVQISDFLRAAINTKREKPIKPIELFRVIDKASKEMQMPHDLASRNLNEGFSGGEKKRHEILQMKLLKPEFAMLDEIDSGLDVDGIRIVSQQINEEKKDKTFLVISHYARLYELINPTRAIVMINGRVAIEGGMDVIKRIDQEGYEWIQVEHNINIEREDKRPIVLEICAVNERSKQ
ncbi:MAG: Fe-S cluster assembly ATPase SufC [Bacilli bacterium]|jgi:Fe-S cluster assembly ATP-binding protein|nr:Fe-S cluster assembly ATPase SufC [Bacillota bacterium]NLI52250.1 Fe-S cluster assembly ATPase SufC [Erysipelotrichaceae bacterium]HOA10800.1 Fe-S cluster assembly ATPase SufC [Bacilli bacterium]TAH56570.1 MAG: Fe-S cluster assembly ATPase SufC [Bacillota bacterium]HOE53619.1 Fe-S cluster assembly ATPase SufC [Bacilli bacterium]